MNGVKKRFIHILTGFVLTAGIVFSPLVSMTAYAMNVRIAFSDPSAQAGSEVSVSMKISSESGEKLGRANIMLSYDASYLTFESGDHAEGGAGSIHVTGQDTTDKTEWAYTLKFKTLQAGSTEIKVSTQEIYDTDEKTGNVDKQGSSKVTITAASSSSGEASLTSLKISPGTLTPAFSADVTEYSATVGEDVDKIAVSAPTKDSNAKVVISGNDALKMGENTITCKVTAQDGTTVKTYTIKVTKQAGTTPTAGNSSDGTSGTKVTVNGTDFDIASSFDESLIPEGYTKTDYSYKGTSVQAAKSKNGDALLLYLIGQGGSGNFYFYDEKTDSWSAYVEISVNKKSITVLPLGDGVQVPAGLTESTLELNGSKVRGWIWSGDTEERYFVVYGMNQDGEKNFYRYDMKEKTIQRYFEDPAADTGVPADKYTEAVNRYESLRKDYRTRGIILIILLVIAVLSLIGMIVAIAMRKRASGRKPERKNIRTEDDSGAPEEVTSEIPEAAEDEEPEETEEEKYLSGKETAESDEKTEKQAEQAQAEIEKKLAGEIRKAKDDGKGDGFEDVKL